jgi:hypothetical protein
MAGSPEHPGDHLIEVVVGEIVGALGYRLILAEQAARLRGVGRSERAVQGRFGYRGALDDPIDADRVHLPSRQRARLRRPATSRARYERQTQS